MTGRWHCPDCGSWWDNEVEECPCMMVPDLDHDPDPKPSHIPDTLEEGRGER